MTFSTRNRRFDASHRAANAASWYDASGTTIGSEYANDALNWNITQGSVYNLLEPLDHIGVTAEYTFGDSGFDAKLGAVNGYFANDPDNNE